MGSIVITKTKVGLILLLAMSFAAGTGVLAYPLWNAQHPDMEQAANLETPKPEAAKRERTDRYGDPLPPGALMRLGSIRMRQGGHVSSVVFTPDGKSVVSGGWDG